MNKVVAVLVCLCVICTGCSYLSSNIVKLRGDEIKGSFAGSPVNISGKNVVITLYREMIFVWKNLKPKFASGIIIEDAKEKGDIEVVR